MNLVVLCVSTTTYPHTPVLTHLQEAWVEDTHEGDYKVSVMVAWIILRSLSFSLEICDIDPHAHLPPAPLLITLLGYCLYLPFLCTGPYMPYTDFRAGVGVCVCFFLDSLILSLSSYITILNIYP